MPGIHDNMIISYEVNLEKKKIAMHTKSESDDFIDIIFTGVMGHFFENELSGSIIFDIEKYDLDQFLKDNNDLLIEHKNHWWPIRYDDIDQLMEILINEQYSYYVIFASYGLSGWVLAKEYQVLQL